MKPIRKCWNVLHGSGVDLWSQMAIFRQEEEKQVTVASQLVLVSVWRPPSLGCWIMVCHNTIYPTAPQVTIPKTSSQTWRLILGLHKNRVELKWHFLNEHLVFKELYQAQERHFYKALSIFTHFFLCSCFLLYVVPEGNSLCTV